MNEKLFMYLVQLYFESKAYFEAGSLKEQHAIREEMLITVELIELKMKEILN